MGKWRGWPPTFLVDPGKAAAFRSLALVQIVWANVFSHGTQVGCIQGQPGALTSDQRARSLPPIKKSTDLWVKRDLGERDPKGNTRVWEGSPEEKKSAQTSTKPREHGVRWDHTFRARPFILPPTLPLPRPCAPHQGNWIVREPKREKRGHQSHHQSIFHYNLPS